MRILVAIIVALAATPALACLDDSDCDAGASCVKGTGLYGVCMGGKASHARDADPRKELPVETEEPAQKACTGDSDCGPGSICQRGACTDH
jgi:hypothetical protein